MLVTDFKNIYFSHYYCLYLTTENLNIILGSNIYYIFSVTASYYITLKHTKVQSICCNWC
jgi:hypothetical protein